MPGMGENALLKMGPVLERLGARQPSYELTDEPRGFLRGLGEDPEDPAGSIAHLRAGECLARGVQAGDVAQAVRFLLSDAAAAITGQALVVDAGASA